MSIPHPWPLGLGVTALLLVAGASSGLVASKPWVCEPLICREFGIATGRFGAGLLRLDPSAKGHQLGEWALQAVLWEADRAAAVGAAALFYALEAQDQTGLTLLWPVISFAAASSVVAHGLTGTYLSALIGTPLGRQAAP